MKSFLIAFLSLVMVNSANLWAHGETPGEVVIGKGAEFAVHRIDRLVTLKRIDPVFVSNLKAVTGERINENGARFRFLGVTEPDAQNQVSAITILMDAQGKVLSHSVTGTVTPANPVSWPSKNAASLIEEALHFVVDSGERFPEIKPFYLGLTSIGLEPLKDKGELLAHLKVTSDDDKRTLHIYLKTDGTYVSHTVQ